MQTQFIAVLNWRKACLLAEYAAQIWRVIVVKPFGYVFDREIRSVEQRFYDVDEHEVYLLFGWNAGVFSRDYIQIIGCDVESIGIERHVVMRGVVAIQKGYEIVDHAPGSVFRRIQSETPQAALYLPRQNGNEIGCFVAYGRVSDGFRARMVNPVDEREPVKQSAVTVGRQRKNGCQVYEIPEPLRRNEEENILCHRKIHREIKRVEIRGYAHRYRHHVKSDESAAARSDGKVARIDWKTAVPRCAEHYQAPADRQWGTGLPVGGGGSAACGLAFVAEEGVLLAFSHDFMCEITIENAIFADLL